MGHDVSQEPATERGPGESADGPLLVVESISKTFAGQRALDKASLTVRPGQIVGLLGQNGAGKSTLIKLLSGHYEPDPGYHILWEGHPVALDERSGMTWRRRLHVIQQELGVVLDLDAVDNMSLGYGYPRGLGGHIKWARARAEATEFVRSFGMEFDVTQPVRTLSRIEQTVVALGRALRGWSAERQLLILDEPTATMPRADVEHLFTVIRGLASRGHAIVIVTHHFEEVLEVATHATVLRDGRTVASEPISRFTHDDLVRLVLGRTLAAERVQKQGAIRQGTALEVRGLVGGRLRMLDLTVSAGEIVGVAGLLGSGREDVASRLFGAIPPDAGSIAVADRPISPVTPRAMMETGVAFVPADCRGAGCIPQWTVCHNVTLPRVGTAFRRGRLRRRLEVADARRWTEAVDLRPPNVDQTVALLSGGNQQKVVLAKCLRLEPKLIVLDEPTQGVDVGARAAIHDLLRQAASRGTAVLVCSSDNTELAALCDRVLIIRGGRIRSELSGEILTDDHISSETLAPESGMAA